MRTPTLRLRSTPLLLLLAHALPARAELVGHWLFDEGAGTVYADSSPNGNDASIPSADIWSEDVPPTGFANAASVNFDGTDDFVSTDYLGIGGNAPRTVAFWLRTNTLNSHGIVAWGNSTVNGAKWHCRLNDNAANGPTGAIRTETQGDFTIGSTALADGLWHHVASVYPAGGGELGTVLHYVDGVLETAGGNNASTQAVDTSLVNDPVTVGRRTQGAAMNYFPGQLDDVRVYDRALDAAEVAGLSGATPTTDGLVLHFPFDEGMGTLVDDLGSGDNDGTLNGAGLPLFPTWSNDAPAHLSQSLLFAGGDMLFTDYPGIAGTASRSLTFWFKTASTADNGILAWGNSSGDGLKWHTRLNSNTADGPLGALRLEIQSGRTVATTPVADGQWHHAAIVFEEDADPDIADVLFYLDGQPDPVSLFTSVPINTQTTGAGAGPVTLGGRIQGANRLPWLGNLADLRIYDTGLTQEQVQDIMAGGGASPAAPFAITQIEFTPGSASATITWNSRPGRFYTVDSSTDLRAGNWLEETDAWESQGDSTSYTKSGIAPGTSKLFFRVSEE